ncbi:MAG: hypothetical protein ABIH19_04755 [Candidatus Omnitrophota bacterium]
MKRRTVLILTFCCFLSVILFACAPVEKAATSLEAIEKSKTMEKVQEKTRYLVSQAKAFYNSKEFQKAVDVAQYILIAVDKESTEAQKIIEKAKAQLRAAAENVAGNVKQKLGAFGK